MGGCGLWKVVMEHDRIGGAQDLRWTYRMEGSGMIIKDGWYSIYSYIIDHRWRGKGGG
jgi:hypothetical protein